MWYESHKSYRMQHEWINGPVTTLPAQSKVSVDVLPVAAAALLCACSSDFLAAV